MSMTDEQIKQNAEQYYQKLDSITIEDPREPNVNSIIDAYIAGAHSRDEEIEKLEGLLDKAVQMLREAYSGSDFFCEKLHEIPEEKLHCMIYCDKDDIGCDCALRYLKYYKKGK